MMARFARDLGVWFVWVFLPMAVAFGVGVYHHKFQLTVHTGQAFIEEQLDLFDDPMWKACVVSLMQEIDMEDAGLSGDCLEV